MTIVVVQSKNYLHLYKILKIIDTCTKYNLLYYVITAIESRNLFSKVNSNKWYSAYLKIDTIRGLESVFHCTDHCVTCMSHICHNGGI